MGKLNALFLAGAVAFGAAGSAHAADLPPAPAFEPVAPEPVDFGGWYLRGDVGVGVSSKPNIRSTFTDAPGKNGAGTGALTAASIIGFGTQDLGDAGFVDLGVGYQFNNWFRVDATGEYRTSEHLSAVESYNAIECAKVVKGCVPNHPYTAQDVYSASIQSSVFLANAYLDIGTWYGLTPFVGAGVGTSFNRVSGLYDFGTGSTSNIGSGNGGFGSAPDKSSFDLAYAGYAGLAYKINPNLKLELAYRYLNMGTVQAAPIVCSQVCAHETQKYKLESNDIKLGMRWMFSDLGTLAPVVYAPPPPVYSPSPPLVRKD